ncbi:MAG: hypothetical protein K1X55_16030 [Chitinophagales bacterium]|nr:hypothetical protein [Chitinophagales bacterium]
MKNILLLILFIILSTEICLAKNKTTQGFLPIYIISDTSLNLEQDTINKCVLFYTKKSIDSIIVIPKSENFQLSAKQVEFIYKNMDLNIYLIKNVRYLPNLIAYNIDNHRIVLDDDLKTYPSIESYVEINFFSKERFIEQLDLYSYKPTLNNITEDSLLVANYDFEYGIKINPNDTLKNFEILMRYINYCYSLTTIQDSIIRYRILNHLHTGYAYDDSPFVKNFYNITLNYLLLHYLTINQYNLFICNSGELDKKLLEARKNLFPRKSIDLDKLKQQSLILLKKNKR